MPFGALVRRPRSSLSPDFLFGRSAARISPGISEGVFATGMPAPWNRAIFSCAVPDPPETIAPACPMRFPGGAVCPATNATTGFVIERLMRSAASSSSLPPISPIRTIASVPGSCS